MNWKEEEEGSSLSINSGCFINVHPCSGKWGWSLDVIGNKDRLSCSLADEFDEEPDAQQAALEYLKELYGDIGRALGIVSDAELVDAIIEAAPEAPPVPALFRDDD